MITALEMDTCISFPVLPPAPAAIHDAVYEFLKPGGLPPTLAGREAAIAAGKDDTAHLMINMYALDGPSRITHVWRHATQQQRPDADECYVYAIAL